MNSQQVLQEKIAERAARELKPYETVNLGIGIPTLIANYVKTNTIFFHTENGMLGVGELEDKEHFDPNLVNAGKRPIAEQIGASYFDSADSFAMIRGGHVDVAVLGGLQVDQTGLLANWAVPVKNIVGVGGAMDLLSGAKKIIVTMIHTAKNGAAKIVKRCSYPISSVRKIDMIITELAVFECKDDQLVLVEMMPEATLEEIKAKTEADFTINLREAAKRKDSIPKC